MLLQLSGFGDGFITNGEFRIFESVCTNHGAFSWTSFVYDPFSPLYLVCHCHSMDLVLCT
jgi:hypothetical protein